MDGHTYVTKGYSNYNDFPAQEGGYAYGPGQHVDCYVVETTVERVHVPASRYTKFGGAPLKNELLREQMLKYAPKDHQKGYEQLYESDYENSSPPRYHERENLMTSFLDKLHIGTASPRKTSDLSSLNKHRPTSPNKYRPTSPNKYRPTSPNKHRPTSPNKYRLISLNNYRPTSPNKYRPTSPNKYPPTSPNKYRPTSPNKYRPTSPNKYRPTSPNKYQSPSPGKHRPTSSTRNHLSKEAHMLKSPTLSRLHKYQPTSPTKYRSTSLTHNYPSKEDHMNKSQNLPDPNKYRPTSPVHGFPLREGQPIRTQSFSDPNKNHSSSLGEGGRHVRVTNFSSPSYHWQSAGPPTTRHPLMTPTNDINEALGFLIESVNYSPRSDPNREGAFVNLSHRAQPIEHERRYARPRFGGVTNRPYLRSNTIDSEEAVRTYNGAYVP